MGARYSEPEFGGFGDRVLADGRVGARTMSTKTHNRLLAASVTVAVVAIFLSMVAVAVYSRHLSADRRQEQIAGCERANQQRVYLNKIIEHHPTFELPPIVIPDCNAIIK